MRNLKWTAGAAAIAASVGLFGISATAANAASLSSCLHSAKQVRQAMAQNKASPRIDDAQRQQRYGREFCNGGFYAKGTAHYAAALKLLGSSGEASKQPTGASQS